MSQKTLFGICTLVILFIGGIFLFVKNSTILPNYKQDLAVSSQNQKNASQQAITTDNETNNKPLSARPGYKLVRHDDHYHEVKTEGEVDQKSSIEGNISFKEEYSSEYNKLTAEVSQLKEKIAIIRKNNDMYKDIIELRTWVNRNLPEMNEIGEYLKPLSSMSADEFYKKYPTVEDRKPVLESLRRIEEFRRQYVSLIENASPSAKELFYAEMEENGYEVQYKKMLKPAWTDSHLMKLLK